MSSGRPRQLTPTQHMDVKMVHTLSPVFSIVYYQAKSTRTFLLTHILSHINQMTQKILLVLAGITQLCKPIPILWDDKHVHRSLGVDVT